MMKMSQQKRRLVWAGMWNLCSGAATGTVGSLFVVFIAHRGLNAEQISLIGALVMVMGVPSCLLWSAAADHFRAHRAILILLVLATAGTTTAMYYGSTFVALLGLVLCNRFVSAAVPPLADAIIISGFDKDADYGKATAWKGIGFACMSALSGFIVDRYGWLAAFILGGALTLLSALPAAALSFRPKEERGLAEQQLKPQQKQQQPGTTRLSSLIFRSVEQPSPLPVTTELPIAPAAQQEDSTHSPGSSSSSSTISSTSNGAAAVIIELLQCQQHQELQAAVHPGSSSSSSSIGSCDESSSASSSDVRILVVGADEPAARQSVQAGDSASSLHTLSPPKTPKSKLAGQEEADNNTPAAEEPCTLSELSRLQKARLLLQNRHVWLLLWQAFLLGLAMGCNTTFLLLMLRDMHASNLMIGLSLTVERLAQFPAFFSIGLLLRVVSLGNVVNLSIGAWVLRLTLTALLPLAGNPWLALPIQLLGAVDFAFGWSSCTIRAKQLAPPGLQATIQGLLATSCMCAGTAVGNVAGGQLVTALGAQWMFGTMAAVMAASGCVSIVLTATFNHAPQK